MRAALPDLRRFADGVRNDGIHRVLLLGMGGSSLGPDALARTFGSADGYPELSVLDSILPSEVRAATDALDPATTLFLVSSKSGTTIETNALYRHFRAVVESSVGRDAAGRHFAAITDPGTPLAALADSENFRRVFINPPDIGGRYSVQSLFGLVPAVLMGHDLDAALDRLDAMRRECSQTGSAHANPGAKLGAAMAHFAMRGQDKLTLLASPSVASFAAWAEQLVAESLGKEGKGVVPVVGEPPVHPFRLDDERLFAHLRLRRDRNAPTDAYAGRVARVEHPVITLKMNDKSDLWGEFFRWEFATAVAGALLGLNPFDQPDVEVSKRLAASALSERDNAPATPNAATLGELIDDVPRGAYLAILAFTRRSPEMDAALAALRDAITDAQGVVTTAGYGPRYLHSTGQLHKGGPANALFLQLVERRESDAAIPGESYTFGQLADAQADGDLRALTALGRNVARVRVSGPGDVRALAAALRASL